MNHAARDLGLSTGGHEGMSLVKFRKGLKDILKYSTLPGLPKDCPTFFSFLLLDGDREGGGGKASKFIQKNRRMSGKHIRNIYIQLGVVFA